nr:NAD-dependent epimerase/dehydratase family protein [Bradyrhizobium centrolobii]
MLTGGAGYIGSHVCIALLGAGFDVVASRQSLRQQRSVPRTGTIHLRAVARLSARRHPG